MSERGGEGAVRRRGRLAAAASRRTMARFMRWPAVKPRSWVSRATWSASARARRVSISSGSKVSASMARRRLALMAKLAAMASAGGAAMPDLGEEVEQRGVVLVDLAQGVFHLGEGLVEDGAQDAVLLVGEERGEGVGECRRRSGR